MDERHLELFKLIHLKSVNIDNKQTGEKMRDIRLSSKDLIKYVCRHSRLGQRVGFIVKKTQDVCGNNFDCKNCQVAFDKEEQNDNINNMSYYNASQFALGRCYGKTEKQISAMESSGKSITLENILTYAYIAKVPLTDIISLQDGYYFDKNGIIRRVGDPEYAPIDANNN